MEHLTKFVKYKEEEYFISTVYTFDKGLETMIFAIVDGEIEWGGIYTEHYSKEKDAIRQHNFICNNIEKFI